ncbi:MAG: type II secretion system F family protein [Bdellovibrio sp.]|nr:type II secretion system F family protein [Bdellovibrio sp.]
MVEFEYQGVDKAGKKITGKMEAPNEGELRMALRAQGVRPTKIGQVGALNRDLGSMFKGAQTVPVEVLVAFSRQLQVLIGAGIPLVQGLDILGEQSTNRAMTQIVGTIREKISAGSYFWESISAYPRVFPKLYVALVRAGEASGALEGMLRRVCRYLEDEDRLRKMLKSAMMYPILVMSIGSGVVAVMLIFVIPKFEEMLKANKQELPGPTQFVINASHFLIGNFMYIAVGFAITFFAVRKYLRTDEGRAVKDRIVFRAPLFGELVRKAAVARFSRTMQTLLASGVNLIDAIDICKSTIDNAVLEDAVGKIRGEVEKGKTLGQIIGSMDVFPRMAVQMIMVGESTGNLDKMLEKVADFFEAETETMVAGMSKLIEPLVLVFLGGTVGGMMIAMYLPIFKLAGGVD